MNRALPSGAPGLAPRLVALAAIVLAAVLRIAFFEVSDRSPDELLYTQFGAGIAREGPAWQTRLVRRYNDVGDTEFPWANRAGWLWIVGGAMRLSGSETPRTIEAVSSLASVANVAVTGAIGWALLGPWPAAIGMLTLATSPLDLGIARRAWQDDTVALLATLLALAALGAARGGRGARVWAAAFFALAAFGMLVKESLAIPAGVGTALLAWEAWSRTRRPWPPIAVLSAGVLALLAAGATVIAVCGGVGELRELLARTPEATAPDEYMRHYQSGGIGYYVRGLAILQPIPWLLGVAGAVLAAARPAWLANARGGAAARRGLAGLALATVAFLAVSGAYFSKNMRFLSPAYGPVALFAGAMLWAPVAWLSGLGRRASAAIAAALLAALVAAMSVRDVARFHYYFVEHWVQDLATPWFTEVDAGRDE